MLNDIEINASGLIQIEAFDKNLGDKSEGENHYLSEEEIEQGMNEFEKFKSQDKKIIKRTEAKNKLESSVFGLKNKFYDKKDEMILIV